MDNEDGVCCGRLQYLWQELMQLINGIMAAFVCWGATNPREDYSDYLRRRRESRQEARLLVLGASDTGKSTFLKQMRLVFGDGYPIGERRRYQSHVRCNLLESLHKMVKAIQIFDIPLNSAEAEEAAQQFLDWESLQGFLQEDALIDASVADAVTVLWEDAGMQEVYIRRSEYHLITNAEYFILNAKRILDKDYVPEVEDILRMRYVTRGPTVTDFELTDLRLRIHDIGGQRPERVTWVNQVHQPSAIIFFASLSEYDQNVEESTEEGTKNRMHESLDVFEEVLAYPPFDDTPIILFLNKSDIFRQKIMEFSLRQFFPEYKGPERDELQGREFITSLYENVTNRHRRRTLVRYTEATNTDDFKAVFSFVSNNVIRETLRKGGLH